MSLEISNVSVTLGGVDIVRDASLTVESGETVALLGPSGAGKSTLLRAIAGLVPISAGDVRWNDASIANEPVHTRRIGFMFQDYALFPHRTVARNVSFGLEMQGADQESIRAAVESSLAWVGLANFDNRTVDTLSGGEQQRVALARAMASEPHVLLLDEPVGALDRQLRAQLTADISQLLATQDLPTIVVTHDQAEAFAIADRVAIMREGRIIVIDEPARLWHSPPDEWTARFLGMTNIVDHPERGRVLIRPEAVSLGNDGLGASVASSTFAEGRYHLVTETDAGWRLAFASTEPAAVGESVFLLVEDGGWVELTD